MVQRLIVNPVTEVKETSVMDAPVQLINPDGTAWTGGEATQEKKPVPYMAKPTLAEIRDTLVTLGLMQPPADTEE